MDLIIGLIFGVCLRILLMQSYLAYGGTVRSLLVLNNTDLYKASISLFFYILFKRGKQYAIYLSGGISCNLDFFIQFLHFVWHFSLDQCYLCRSVQMGIKDWFLYLVYFHILSVMWSPCCCWSSETFMPKNALWTELFCFLFRFVFGWNNIYNTGMHPGKFHQSVDHVRNPEPLEVIYLGSIRFYI